MNEIRPINPTTYEVEMPSGDKVEIGAREAVDFKPSFKLNRWGGECFINLDFDDSAIQAKDKQVKIEEGKVKWETPLFDFHYHAKESRRLEPVVHGSCNQCGKCCVYYKCPHYDPAEPDKCSIHIDKAEQQQRADETYDEWMARRDTRCPSCFKPSMRLILLWLPECGFSVSWERIGILEEALEIEIVLKQKPLVNVLSFPIKAEGLRFSYQPFLTEQDKAEGVVRPPNVEGSYAVYHKTKKNNQYMTGKAFHIYRPIAEDALGNKAWCSIHIDGYLNPKNVTIMVPQQFLDEAVYPVTIDPDFGRTSIGGTQYSIAAGPIEDTSYRRGSAWTMPAGGGTANYIRARLRSEVTDHVDCKVFINQKDSGGAGTHGQIATDENLGCVNEEHWEEFTLAEEELTAAVVYILSVIGDYTDVSKKANYFVYGDENGAVASYYESHNYGAPESPWVVNPEGTTKDYSIYCNYSEEEVAKKHTFRLDPRPHKRMSFHPNLKLG